MFRKYKKHKDKKKYIENNDPSPPPQKSAILELLCNFY